VVEHGGVGGGHGSEVAGPICRDVLREVQRRDPARRVPGGDTVAQLHSLDRFPPRADAPGG
jgi:hypothetical protein